ncbi:FAD:protein FMN transferase [Arthrobacter sp. NPDC090010]|uniref:FAD:protein FMN transferase n=1 Tax=Arthrobacter sp. NPDC090010 TaxID=3363942 RepID=UPI00380BE611
MSTSEVWEFEALGTRWWIRATGLSPDLRASITGIITEFDATWSRFRPDAAIRQLAEAASSEVRTLSLPEEAGKLGRLYGELHELSGGSVTPFIGASLARLGYDEHYSFRAQGAAVPAPRWGVDAHWEDREIRATGPVIVDIGAAGKGLAVDLVSEFLGASGAGPFLVDASGDLRSGAGSEDRIALENPFDTSQAIGVVSVADAALAASAVNRRSWGEGLHHVLDGLSGLPVRKVMATWVLAPTAMLADGLATALFFVPGEELSRRYAVEWLSVHSDGHAEGSRYFLEGLF